jgi:hypothetical protein
LRHYATSHKVAGSRPDEVNAILPVALGPGADSISNRNEYQKQKNNASGGKERPARKADNLAAVCEPTV